jgi:acetyl-CoA C-acetyltransferase
MHEFNLSRSVFGGFALTAHANGVGNPNAMFRKAITREMYDQAGMVSEPINLFDAAPNADGAAAIVLTRSDLLPPNFPNALVRLRGSSLVTDTVALHDRPDPLAFQAARLSVERACRQAKITPLQADLFELHDSFSIYAALALEAAGFAGRGQGWKLAEDGHLSLNGSLPVACMGGLKARGNPGGAAGIYQVVEVTLQLRGQAGKNQIPGARRALVQNLGGPASTAVTHVLETA